MKGKELFWDEKGMSREEYGDFHSLLLDIFDRDALPDDFLNKLSKNPDNKVRLLNAIQQGRKVLEMKDFPWEYIHYNANYHKLEKNEAAVRSWLINTLSTIERNLSSSI